MLAGRPGILVHDDDLYPIHKFTHDPRVDLAEQPVDVAGRVPAGLVLRGRERHDADVVPDPRSPGSAPTSALCRERRISLESLTPISCSSSPARRRYPDPGDDQRTEVVALPGLVDTEPRRAVENGSRLRQAARCSRPPTLVCDVRQPSSRSRNLKPYLRQRPCPSVDVQLRGLAVAGEVVLGAVIYGLLLAISRPLCRGADADPAGTSVPGFNGPRSRSGLRRHPRYPCRRSRPRRAEGLLRTSGPSPSPFRRGLRTGLRPCPSGRFLTHPARPSSSAFCLVESRKKTPCTWPEMQDVRALLDPLSLHSPYLRLCDQSSAVFGQVHPIC